MEKFVKEGKGDSMQIGFDSDKYLSLQSQHIKDRIKKFGKLYLEFGGKLFDDYHACFPDLLRTIS